MVRKESKKMMIYEKGKKIKKLIKEFEENPLDNFDSENLKGAQLFRMTFFRSIRFAAFKWKEFQLY